MDDPWLSAYDSCDRLAQDVREQITQRNRHPRGSSMYTRDSAHIRTNMMKFTGETDDLRQELIRAGTQHRLTQREVDRRQMLLDKLTTKKKQLEQAAKQEDSMGHRTDLLGPLGDVGGPWGGASSSQAMEDSNNPFTSVDDIRQQQHQIIREQDQGLDALSAILGRQKQMAVDIGNEVDGQNELIDDITDHVDHTNTRLIRETKHIKIIDRKSNTCWMWVVIVLLLVAILVICVIPKSKLHL